MLARKSIASLLIAPLVEIVGTGDMQDCGVWYDWFCTDRQLVTRGKSLWSKVKSIMASNKFDPTQTYIFFKNNSPCSGPLYDDFRICDVATGDLLFTVVPNDPRRGTGEVWGRSPSGEFGKLFTGDWKEIKAWFLAK